MFDFGIGASELMIIAAVALIVVGPRELPKVLRAVGRFMNQLRGMASEFQRHLDAAMRETGIDEVKKDVRNLTSLGLTDDVGKQMSDTFSKQGAEMKRLLEAREPDPAPLPASQTPSAVSEGEEQKAGAEAS
jgi:sec-independent protein translocase protein TatB